MNYDAARQVDASSGSPKAGRWDYTTRNDSNIRPLGYCAGWRSPTPEQREKLIDRLGEHAAKSIDEHWLAMEPHRAKFHDDGHATSDEACECYKRFLLDTQVVLDGMELMDWSGCRVCDAPTKKTAKVCGAGMNWWPLCNEHRTHEIVATLLTVGESMHS